MPPSIATFTSACRSCRRTPFSKRPLKWSPATVMSVPLPCGCPSAHSPSHRSPFGKTHLRRTGRDSSRAPLSHTPLSAARAHPSHPLPLEDLRAAPGSCKALTSGAVPLASLPCAPILKFRRLKGAVPMIMITNKTADVRVAVGKAERALALAQAQLEFARKRATLGDKLRLAHDAGHPVPLKLAAVASRGAASFGSWATILRRRLAYRRRSGPLGRVRVALGLGNGW
eukprot:scaffold119636_cov30-Tisochrysis_lutea.AAC.3